LSSCHWKEKLGIEKKTEGADEEKIGLEGNGACPSKRLLTNLKLYLSGAVLAGHVEQTILLPTNFHVGRRVANDNKLKISNESSTTSVSFISTKTVEEMFTQDGVSNQTIYAADKPTTDGCTDKFITKKPTQPCYIWQNVWCKQIGTHIANLQILGKAPSDGCTVVHVLLQCKLDQMVEHGAQVIHLYKPMGPGIQ